MVDQITTTRQSIADGAARLMEEIENLGGAGMAGTANGALQGTSGALLNDGLTKVLSALDQLGDFLTGASQSSQSRDEEAAADIAKAANAHGGHGSIASVLSPT